ncbi:MAG: hypothetical protein ACR2MQ_12780, partial [Gemmatimonadaceae bacterium]
MIDARNVVPVQLSSSSDQDTSMQSNIVRHLILATTCALTIGLPTVATAQRDDDSHAADSIKYKYASSPQLDALKTEAARGVEAKAKMIQQMVDQVYSYGELGFQEFETSKYLSKILEDSGFTVTRGVAGIPTAFVARWGSGKPVISLGSDIDDIP